MSNDRYFMSILPLHPYWQIKHGLNKSFISKIHNWMNDHIQKGLITGSLWARKEVNENGLHGFISSPPWAAFPSTLRMEKSESQSMKISTDWTLNNCTRVKENRNYYIGLKVARARNSNGTFCAMALNVLVISKLKISLRCHTSAKK